MNHYMTAMEAAFDKSQFGGSVVGRINCHLGQLHLMSPEYRENDRWYVKSEPDARSIRLVWFHEDRDGVLSASDIKEQDIWVSHSCDDKDRLEQFWTAWRRVVEDILQQGEIPLIPSDLLTFRSHPLDLKTANSIDDFEAALRTISRLGKYLN